jgi:tetratricopeptide (TPR) repeat protein
LLLAELYIRNDDVEAAKSLFADPASFDATDGLFLALAGRLSLQAGRSDLATAYFDRSEQSRPSTVRELVGVTSIYVAAGEFERSIRLLQEATPDDAASGLVRDYLLALMQARQGDLDAAAATADRLRAAQPDASWPLNLRGAIALAANDFQAAKDLYTEALNLEPNNVAASLNLARVAVALGDTGEATRHLLRVTAIEPQDATANFGLAQLAAQRGDIRAAHSFLARAAESPLRLRLQGELYTAEGRFAEAAAAFGRAFELQPSSDLAFSRYAAATRAGLPEPESSLLVWAAQNPRDVQVHYVLGLLAQAAGDSDAAVSRYEGVIANAPQHAAALNNLAGIYAQRGDTRALELAARAHAASPGDPAVADTLGWIHVGSGNPRAGLPLLEQARAGLPDHPEIRYHWAVALAETGDREQALRELRALLSSGVTFPSRSDAQGYLRGLEEQG